jgi:surface polysaccharide O-acyltransferase-like enzyme
MGKKKRNASIELLRILAMLMVITLHYLSKSGILPPLTQSFGRRGMGAWLLESFSIVAVNVYMLISGFFLSGSVPKASRMMSLICQVLFYSLLVPFLLLGAGMIHWEDITRYQLIQYIFPIQMGDYWFATAYVVLYLLSPLLGTAVRHMSKQQLGVTLGGLLFFFSVVKSILPIRLTSDQMGYDSLWFICVYLTAAYIRRFGLPGGKLFGSRKKGFAWYFLSCGGIFVLAMLLRQVYLATGLFQDYLYTLYGYNHILNLLGAVGLFYGFMHITMKDGRLSAWICRIAPYTFGVYLLHEQIEVRYLWPKWLGAGEGGSIFWVLAEGVCSVLLVFAVGIIADMIRGWVFRQVGRILAKTPILQALTRVDSILSDPRSREMF